MFLSQFNILVIFFVASVLPLRVHVFVYICVNICYVVILEACLDIQASYTVWPIIECVSDKEKGMSAVEATTATVYGVGERNRWQFFSIQALHNSNTNGLHLMTTISLWWMKKHRRHGHILYIYIYNILYTYKHIVFSVLLSLSLPLALLTTPWRLWSAVPVSSADFSFLRSFASA